MPITFAQTSDEIDEERACFMWGLHVPANTCGSHGRIHGPPVGGEKRRRSRFLDDIDPSRKAARHS